MTTPNDDPLRRIAGLVADCFMETGYAFIEDDKIDGLAATLKSFLTVAEIPVHTADAGEAGTAVAGRC